MLLLDQDTPESLRQRLITDAARLRITVVSAEANADLRTIDRVVVSARASAIAVCGPAYMQATAAAIASGLGLPLACIGARRADALARDLGVAADDPGLVLSHLIAGVGRTMDLAEVNGIVFVNCVRLAVDHPERAALQPRLLTAPVGTVLRRGPVRGLAPWSRPGAVLAVSNNVFMPDGAHGMRRERLDAGRLGVVLLGRTDAGERGPGRLVPQATVTCSGLELSADGQVVAEVDGRALVLQPPLRLRTIPAAVRIRSGAATPPGAARRARSAQPYLILSPDSG